MNLRINAIKTINLKPWNLTLFLKGFIKEKNIL